MRSFLLVILIIMVAMIIRIDSHQRKDFDPIGAAGTTSPLTERLSISSIEQTLVQSTGYTALESVPRADGDDRWFCESVDGTASLEFFGAPDGIRRIAALLPETGTLSDDTEKERVQSTLQLILNLALPPGLEGLSPQLAQQLLVGQKIPRRFGSTYLTVTSTEGRMLLSVKSDEFFRQYVR